MATWQNDRQPPPELVLLEKLLAAPSPPHQFWTSLTQKKKGVGKKSPITLLQRLLGGLHPPVAAEPVLFSEMPGGGGRPIFSSPRPGHRSGRSWR